MLNFLIQISLWHDEAFSGLLVKYGLKEMIYRTGLDVHPPLYYILLKGWVGVLGNSPLTLRLFSIFFGALAVFALFLFVKQALKDKKLALFSAILLALNSFFIQFVMEARMFTLGIFLVLISSFLLLKALDNKKWLWWLLYGLSVGGGIYTHYYIFFSVLAQAIFIIYWIFKKSDFNALKFTGTAYGLAGLSFLPWLKTFLSQFGQVQQGYWIPPINFGSVPGTIFKITTGGEVNPANFWQGLTVLIIAVFFAVFYFLRKNNKIEKWLLLFLLAVPFLGAILLSIKTSIYLDRYFIFVSPFYITILAGAILSIKNKWLKNIFITAAILGSLISFPIRWSSLQVENKPGMAEAAAYVNQDAKPGDKIFVGSSFVYFTFKYYNQTGIQPLLYTPVALEHFSGTALLSAEDTISDFAKAVEKNNTVWLINTTGFGNYRPAAPKGWQELEEKGFQDVYDYRGWIIVSKYIIDG